MQILRDPFVREEEGRQNNRDLCAALVARTLRILIRIHRRVGRLFRNSGWVRIENSLSRIHSKEWDE
ncbi:hypothetical protein MAALD49_39690 (plasmid) [Marinobacter shengliensis]|nr:hypothetical protein MAALD49_39690 [Marinobacter shengliensis]